MKRFIQLITTSPGAIGLARSGGSPHYSEVFRWLVDHGHRSPNGRLAILGGVFWVVDRTAIFHLPSRRPPTMAMEWSTRPLGGRWTWFVDPAETPGQGPGLGASPEAWGTDKGCRGFARVGRIVPPAMGLGASSAAAGPCVSSAHRKNAVLRAGCLVAWMKTTIPWKKSESYGRQSVHLRAVRLGRCCLTNNFSFFEGRAESALSSGHLS